MYIIHNKKAISIDRKTFLELKITERYDLQEWIADNPKMLGENLLIIQKEFDGFPDTNERLDLLALDENGKIVVIENKLDDSGKDVVWQSLKYVSYCATLTKAEICEIYQRYLGTSMVASEKISEFYDEQDFENIKLNPAGSDQRIILVAANFRKEVTSTVLWLRDHGIDITCIKVTPYKYEEKLFLDVEQILPMQDVDNYRITLKKQEEAIVYKEEASRLKSRYNFWVRALPVLRQKTDIFNNISPSKDHWLTASSGHSGFVFCPVIKINGARAEFYIDTGDKLKNKKIFNELKTKTVDNSLNSKLEWQELPDKQACRVCINYNDYGLNDEEHWDEIINFIADSLSQIINFFRPLLDKILKNI